MRRATLIKDPVVSSFVFNFFTNGAAHLPLSYPNLESYIFDNTKSFFLNLTLAGGGVKVRPVVLKADNKIHTFMFYSINGEPRIIYLDIGSGGN